MKTQIPLQSNLTERWFQCKAAIKLMVATACAHNVNTQYVHILTNHTMSSIETEH